MTEKRFKIEESWCDLLFVSMVEVAGCAVGCSEVFSLIFLAFESCSLPPFKPTRFLAADACEVEEAEAPLTRYNEYRPTLTIS